MADPTNNKVQPDTPPRKILFLGDEGVGKTTFITRYLEYMRDNYGCQNYRGIFTVFTQFLYYRDPSECGVPIQFLDLPAGVTEESRADQYPKRVNLVVLCFSIDNPNSLDNVWQVWLPEFRRYLHDSTRFYLLGLKNDTRPEMLAADRTPVTEERAKQIHEQHQFKGEYLECSVEENPEQARQCMDKLITDVSKYFTPPFRAVD